MSILVTVLWTYVSIKEKTPPVYKEQKVFNKNVLKFLLSLSLFYSFTSLVDMTLFSEVTIVTTYIPFDILLKSIIDVISEIMVIGTNCNIPLTLVTEIDLIFSPAIIVAVDDVGFGYTTVNLTGSTVSSIGFIGSSRSTSSFLSVVLVQNFKFLM